MDIRINERIIDILHHILHDLISEIESGVELPLLLSIAIDNNLAKLGRSAPGLSMCW